MWFLLVLEPWKKSGSKAKKRYKRADKKEQFSDNKTPSFLFNCIISDYDDVVSR